MEKQYYFKGLGKYLMVLVLINQEIEYFGDGIKLIMEVIMVEIQELSDNK